MYLYKSTNPCICTPTISDPPCPDDCNCLKLCHITINGLSEDAVGPCGATGSIDISDESYGHDFCACGANPLVWGIEEYPTDIFVSVSINSSGVLTWVTKGEDTAGKYGCIIVCLSCGNLKVYAYVLIGVKDLCYGCTGSTCQDCDPCTGTYSVSQVNASIKTGATSSNASISGS